MSAACIAALVVAGCGAAGSASSRTALRLPVKTLTIALSDPGPRAHDRVARDVVDAEQLAFDKLHGEVDAFKLRLKLLSNSPVSDNARRAILYPSTRRPSVIAYLGEIAPGVSDQTVGITNALGLLQVSPTDTALELGHSTPAVKNAPKSYFQSWGTYGRTFARMAPTSAQEAAVQVAEMRKLGVASLYVGNDGSDYGRALSDALALDAHVAGITLRTSADAAGADFYAATSGTAAARFFDRVAHAHPSAKLFGPSALDTTAFMRALAPAVKRLYVSLPGFMPGAVGAAGRRFATAFKSAYGRPPGVQAIFGYAAMQAVLHVLARLGKRANNRTAVVKEFLHQHDVTGVLGDYSIDADGNSSIDAFVFAHPRGGTLVPFQAAPGS